MKKYIYLSAIALSIGCSSEQTDQLLLEKDKIDLAKSLTSDKIVVWKFGKIGLRAAGVQDTTMAEYQQHAKELQSVSQSLATATSGNKNIPVTDLYRMYRDYHNIKSFVIKTDEDIFPPLTDGVTAVYGDPQEKQAFIKTTALRSKADKLFLQNLEHAVLSMAVLATKELGMEISLYECSKTQPDQLPDSEIKTLLQFVRGFLFFSNKFYYLSEDEISSNLKWLDKNQQLDLPYTRSFFSWGKFNNEQTHVAFHGLNCLFRGFDRLMMKRDIDQERALDDFELFLEDAHQLGIQNETVWAIESYVFIKRGKKEQAIVSLNHLKNSPLLSDQERSSIAQSITYLKERDGDSKLSGVYDQVFISKIATRYMLATLAKIDWRKLMKENNVSHTDEIFSTLEQFKALSAQLQGMTDTKTFSEKAKALEGKTPGLKETGKDLKEKGAQLLDKVSDLW